MKIPSSNLGVQKLFLTFRTILVHNMFSPCSAKRRASDKDLPVQTTMSPRTMSPIVTWLHAVCSSKKPQIYLAILKPKQNLQITDIFFFLDYFKNFPPQIDQSISRKKSSVMRAQTVFLLVDFRFRWYQFARANVSQFFREIEVC